MLMYAIFYEHSGQSQPDYDNVIVVTSNDTPITSLEQCDLLLRQYHRRDAEVITFTQLDDEDRPQGEFKMVLFL